MADALIAYEQIMVISLYTFQNLIERRFLNFPGMLMNEKNLLPGIIIQIFQGLSTFKCCFGGGGVLY